MSNETRMDLPLPPPRAVIFDLGDVLFSWSASTTTPIPARQLRDILTSPIWFAYDRGEITRDVCYQLSAEKFCLSAPEIAEAFAQARRSLQPDPEILSLIQKLNKNPAVKVYAMSNIGKEDFEELATRIDWSLFHHVFTSAAAGMRKPEPRFYRYVLDRIGLAGNEVVFIDDKEENICSAKSLGIRGYVFEHSRIQSLRTMLQSPVGRAWTYLIRNAKTCNSVTNSGVGFSDNFAKLLIADTLKYKALIDLQWGSKTTWNFFNGETVLIPGGLFPDDLDTTSLALQVLQPPSKELVSTLLDQMAGYANQDGTFQTYFDRTRARVDPIVSANILACFYYYGRGDEFPGTLELVRSMLAERSYLQGTRYYPSADCCLGFVGRLLRCGPGDAHLRSALGPLLESRVRERLGRGGSALDLAMRVMACAQVGVDCRGDRQALQAMQRDDGSWEPGWMYQYGSTGVKIGNRCVTTAMAVAALSAGGESM